MGLTEAQARKDYDVVTATVPYTELDRAVIDGRTEGLCKLVVSRRTRRILGAHVVGEQALEIVHVAAAGIVSDMEVDELAEMQIAYPTFTAILGLAARQAVRELDGKVKSIEWASLVRTPPAEWEMRQP